MTKIWRSASREMVSQLREFCFHMFLYPEKRKENVCGIGKREKGKKKIILTVYCLHNLLYAAVINQVYEICNFF